MSPHELDERVINAELEAEQHKSRADCAERELASARKTLQHRTDMQRVAKASFARRLAIAKEQVEKLRSSISAGKAGTLTVDAADQLAEIIELRRTLDDYRDTTAEIVELRAFKAQKNVVADGLRDQVKHLRLMLKWYEERYPAKWEFRYAMEERQQLANDCAPWFLVDQRPFMERANEWCREEARQGRFA